MKAPGVSYWGARHARAFRAVARALDGDGIEWMLLRNFRGLPEANPGKDVDVLVRKGLFARARVVIAAALRAHGFTREVLVRHQYAWCMTFISTGAPETISLKIDMAHSVAWHGVRVLEFGAIHARSVVRRGIRVPDRVMGGFLLWLRMIVSGAGVPARYRAEIARSVRSHPVAFRWLMADALGEGLADASWRDLAREGVGVTAPARRSMPWILLMRALTVHPVRTLADLLEHGVREVARRCVRRPGSLIAVLGPDGAGKTTFAGALRDELARIFVRDRADVHIAHFRPNLLPNLKPLLLGASYDARRERFTDPHRARPANPLSSLMRLTYYWLDYVVGYWAVLRRRCIAGRTYVFDRYAHDLLVDPLRSRILLPLAVRRLYVMALPRPDVVLVLDCDGATIRRRKQELERREVDRQLAAYRALAVRRRDVVLLDARRPVSALRREAGERIVELCCPEVPCS